MSWFEQVTSEHVETVLTKSGFPRREWKVLSGRQNHWLDCRVYNHAAAEKLMLDTGDEASWARTRAQRYALRTPGQGDLLDLLSQPVKGQGGAPAPSRAQVAVQQPIPRNAPAYIEARDGWL